MSLARLCTLADARATPRQASSRKDIITCHTCKSLEVCVCLGRVIPFKNWHQAPCGSAAVQLLRTLTVRNWGLSTEPSRKTRHRKCKHVILILLCSPELYQKCMTAMSMDWGNVIPGLFPQVGFFVILLVCASEPRFEGRQLFGR